MKMKQYSHPVTEISRIVIQPMLAGSEHLSIRKDNGSGSADAKGWTDDEDGLWE